MRLNEKVVQVTASGDSLAGFGAAEEAEAAEKTVQANLCYSVSNMQNTLRFPDENAAAAAAAAAAALWSTEGASKSCDDSDFAWLLTTCQQVLREQVETFE